MSKVTKTKSSSPGTPVRKLEAEETLLKLGPFPGKPVRKLDMEETLLGPFLRKPDSNLLLRQIEDDWTVWDEKGRTQIAQIFILYGKDISSIAFQYIEDGKLVMSPFFGSQELKAPNFVAVTFCDAPNEYITRLRGWYCHDATRSLKIETNIRSYGPFGNPQPNDTNIRSYDALGNPQPNDTKFDFSFGPENQFGGFHGLCCNGLFRSIGVYVKPIHTLASLSSVSLDD